MLNNRYVTQYHVIIMDDPLNIGRRFT